MFEFLKKNEWTLDLSGNESSPVSWNMIRDGLIGLKQTDDDSFLVLIKNPGKPNERFLQTALPAISSGQPPLYRVETSVYEDGTHFLYTLDMSELNEVIAFFKNYFNGGTLDLSLFTLEHTTENKVKEQPETDMVFMNININSNISSFDESQIIEYCDHYCRRFRDLAYESVKEKNTFISTFLSYLLPVQRILNTYRTQHEAQTPHRQQ